MLFLLFQVLSFIIAVICVSNWGLEEHGTPAASVWSVRANLPICLHQCELCFSDSLNALKGFLLLTRYKRDDGVDMTATLYLPPGYDKGKDGALPCLIWAYPREFKSKDAAGRVALLKLQHQRLIILHLHP